MGEQGKHPGRWVYTSACARFEGDSAEVVGWSGSIHAGWQDSPRFQTAEEFYAWAKAECERRNTIETAAPALLEALKALQLQALQSPDLLKTEWGQEALAKTEAAIALADLSARRGFDTRGVGVGS